MDLMAKLMERAEPVAMQILKELKGTELLHAMEVSRTWKSFIEADERKTLMEHALSNTRICINLQDFKLPTSDRRYKNMRLTFPSEDLKQFMISKCVMFLHLYAPSLQSLEICRSPNMNFDIGPLEVNFVMLRELSFCCYGSPFKLLQNCSFPELTSLQLFYENRAPELKSLEELKQFLRVFPKLKHLKMELSIESAYEFSFYSNFEEEFDQIHAAPPHVDTSLPQLETIDCQRFYYAPKFFQTQQNSLTELLIDSMSKTMMICCLRDLKQLKTLKTNLDQFRAPGNAEDGERILPQNDSLEKLLLMAYIPDTDEDLREIVLALPSLKEFILGSCNIVKCELDFQFIGKN